MFKGQEALRRVEMLAEKFGLSFSDWGYGILTLDKVKKTKLEKKLEALEKYLGIEFEEGEFSEYKAVNWKAAIKKSK